MIPVKLSAPPRMRYAGGMPKPVVILALLVAAWVLYTHNGGRFPSGGLGNGLVKGDGRAVPAAPAIVTGGARDAAGGL